MEGCTQGSGVKERKVNSLEQGRQLWAGRNPGDVCPRASGGVPCLHLPYTCETDPVASFQGLLSCLWVVLRPQEIREKGELG